MKSFLVALVISVVIVSGSLMYTNHLDGVARELAEQNGKITEFVAAGDFAGALDAAKGLEDCLNKNKVLLAATGNHDELLKIELACAELKEYAAAENAADAASKCASLDVMIQHMPSNYKIKVENIL